MDVFKLRNNLIDDYKSYVESFINIRDHRIKDHVKDNFEQGILWPEPLIQLNPSFESGGKISDLVDAGILHPECNKIFRIQKSNESPGKIIRLHKHQTEAIRIAKNNHNFVLTTGTGSGKSLTYIIPIVDYVLRSGSGKGIKAIIVYPMNALANSQYGELEKFLRFGYPDNYEPVKFGKYTGQESSDDRENILKNPPDILLTNYVMLELIMTRPDERRLINAAQGLKFFVLDELHTHRGRQGADVAFLTRRVKQALNATELQCIGTSATLASEGLLNEQQKEVANVASQLFGAPVKDEHIVGETLQRITPVQDQNGSEYIEKLRGRVQDKNYIPSKEYEKFINDPLSIWIEDTFGLSHEEESNRLIRAEPISIYGDNGAAAKLSELIDVDVDQCSRSLEIGLLAGYKCEPNPETNFPPFAFRLHQYISRGETVYASLEEEKDRHITLFYQQYVPGDRSRILLPLVFCRECGQEYYCVHKLTDTSNENISFSLRELTDQSRDDNMQPGFLHWSTASPWPTDIEELLTRLPDDWLTEQNGKLKIRPNRRDHIPNNININPNGQKSDEGKAFQYFNAPFRFCLNCGVSYDFRQQSDFSKLSTLSSEGRSTATTILTLSSILRLKKEISLKPVARKLLSFTDNRQDASLQAGHFNDFVEVGWLRSALYKAVEKAENVGIEHENIAMQVFTSLNLPLELYAVNPTVRFQALKDTERALRNVIGYRIYRDLKRGWRITSPNLEQCGLLEIYYHSLEDVCNASDLWEKRHPALLNSSEKTREIILKVLLDYMRRELAVKVDYLDQNYQERLQQQSSQYLISPWAIDEDEMMIHASVLYPRSKREGDYRGNIFLSPRSGFGLFLRRGTTFTNYPSKLKMDETERIITELLDVLEISGLLEIVDQPRNEDEVPGYQLKASALQWSVGDGTKPFHDPIRVPNLSSEGGRTNQFFIDYYKNIAFETIGFEAREHTAQVPYEDRENREKRFRTADLPILFCSPTMELGVDIAELNLVNLRNVPPTPANYAQRSGRAGRSGQPALVLTYCTTGSSHDQYFFKRPQLMVAGSVSPPRIDLANEDLIRAHVNAVWLAETGLSLGKSLKDLLALEGEEPTLELLDFVQNSISSQQAKKQAYLNSEQVLHAVKDEMQESDWYAPQWLDDVFTQIQLSFDNTCERWRNLYRAALSQAKSQDKIIRDATRSPEDKRRAERLRKEAESQLKLLTEVENIVQSDFYSYRYFASEGFLPGYNFPRLPISAYIPGRRTKQRDEFLSRPRFLAISEFGPQSIIYHEGSRYIINKVIMPMQDDTLETNLAKICQECGYLHPIINGDGPDLCENCSVQLNPPYRQLFRLRNVSTKRRDRINSDEEERLRLGYDLLTSVRFTEHSNTPSYRHALIKKGEEVIGTMKYGHTATIWRINLGWRRRKNRRQHGFVLDKERGLWEKNELVQKENDDDAFSKNVERVIPFVEDRRNSLLLELTDKYDDHIMASLQAALKNAIQVEYQLEDNEMAVEPLPQRDNRQFILFYEAAEGGAGVLKRLVTEPTAFSKVIRSALQICHFDPTTGKDEKRAPRAKEDCEAACYDCLMNYGNQLDHALLDRKAIVKILLEFAQTSVSISPVGRTRVDHLEFLLSQCDSDLEREWLRFLEDKELALPDSAQKLFPECQTRPDFVYTKSFTAIYIDGPHHDFPERKGRDQDKSDCMENMGYIVVRFDYKEKWTDIIEQYPHVFGRSK